MPQDPTLGYIILVIVTSSVTLAGGAFGQRLLDRWAKSQEAKNKVAGASSQREFTDNEQARRFLAEQLREKEEELAEIRKSERSLLQNQAETQRQIGEMTAQISSLAREVSELREQAKKWGTDLEEMKKERDYYRQSKHDSDNRTTSLLLSNQLLEKENQGLRKDLDQTKGQLEAVLTRPAAKDS